MHSDERGSALVIVLLMLMLMSALAAALGTSGQTETLISRNHRSQIQAQLAAEAGLNHASAVAIDYIFNWSAHGCGGAGVATDDGVKAALYTLLVGPTAAAGGCNVDGSDGTVEDFLSIKGIPPATLGEAGARDATDLAVDGAADCTQVTATCYEVTLLDDPQDGCDPATQQNCKLDIQATGYGADDTKVTVQAVLSPLTLPAVATNGNLTINGHVSVVGSGGSVHSNGNIIVSGTSATVSGPVTASGTYTAPVGSTISGSGGNAEVHIPTVTPSDYESRADRVLTADGRLTYTNGTLICNASGNGNPCQNSYGVTFSSTGPTWNFVNSHVNGTYYVHGDAHISGPGTAAVSVSLSVIAEGSIELGGNSYLAPASPELLLVAGKDLKISGGGEVGDVNAQGQMLVHEQLDIPGSPTLGGQIIVEDAPNTSGSPVTSNSISGNPNITYSGGLGTGTYSVSAWLEVR